jgi:hypothetical protein
MLGAGIAAAAMNSSLKANSRGRNYQFRKRKVSSKRKTYNAPVVKELTPELKKYWAEQRLLARRKRLWQGVISLLLAFLVFALILHWAGSIELYTSGNPN